MRAWERLAGALAVTVASGLFAAGANAAEGDISFLECIGDDSTPSLCPTEGGSTDGLGSAFRMDVSPDSKHVYVASLGEDSVATFARNSSAGGLDFVSCTGDKDTGAAGCSNEGGTVDGLNGGAGVAVSPDGASVYVTGYIEGTIAHFQRNAATGALDFIGCLKDSGAASTCSDEGGTVGGIFHAVAVEVSPDGKNVYVAGEDDFAVATFARNTTTGALDFTACVEDLDASGPCDNEGGSVDGLDGVYDLAISPDGANLYTTSLVDSAVATFSRNTATGALDFTSCTGDTGGPSGCGTEGATVDGLAGGLELAVSPDGANVYAVGQTDSALASFSRAAGTGALDWTGCIKETGSPATCSDEGGTVDGMMFPGAVEVSADGKSVYVASQSTQAVATLTRSASGALDWTGCLQDRDSAGTCPDGGGAADGLAGPTALGVSPDGRALHLAANTDDAVAVFTRERDTTDPETTLNSAPPQLTTDPTADFTFSTPDPFGDGFECSLDGGAYGPCSGDGTHTTAALSDGVHRFGVRALDTAGNADGTPATSAFVVDAVPDDTTAPEVFLLKTPKNKVKSKKGKRKAPAKWTFVANEMDVTYECAVKGGSKKQSKPRACTSPHKEKLKAGKGKGSKYTFIVNATDAAGNKGPDTRDKVKVKRGKR